jgi:hypothetical protein
MSARLPGHCCCAACIEPIKEYIASDEQRFRSSILVQDAVLHPLLARPGDTLARVNYQRGPVQR